MKRVLISSGVALGALWALSAQAKEGDTIQAFVSYGHFYDSNLLRLADGEPIFENGALNTNPQHSDQYSVLSVGATLDWKPGRQQILASATKTRTHFNHYSAFDNDGYDYRGTWNWRLGNRLSGTAGASEVLSQSSFQDVGQINNQNTNRRSFGRAEWEFHPRWRIGGGVEQIDSSNSALSQKSQDSQQKAYDVVVRYLTPKGSDLRAQVRRLDVEFPTPQILALPFLPLPFAVVADNSYKQTEYTLLGDWSASGKLALRGQVGWVERSYENILESNIVSGFYASLTPRPDFSGLTGRMSADWYATGKTLFSVSVYREPGTAQDINASSVLKEGASVNGVWVVREKWRMNAGVSFENRDFKGDPGVTQQQRNDDTWGTSLSLSYAPIRDVSVDIGVNAGRRDSNMPVEDYKFHSMFVNVRADF